MIWITDTVDGTITAVTGFLGLDLRSDVAT